MLAQRSVDHPAIEENLGGVGNIIKHLERLVELTIIVVRKRLNPRLDFLGDR